MTATPITPAVAIVAVSLAVAFGAGLWQIAMRVIGHSGLQRWLLASYALRALLGVALFAISFYHWPILAKLQWQPGFWMFALDAAVYHHYGHHIAQAWQLCQEVPDPELGIEFFLIVATLYRLLRSCHPLYPILMNAGMAVLAAILAYRLARRLTTEPRARLIALLVAWWPSSIFWSSQLLKDALSWCLIFAVLLLLTELWDRIAGGLGTRGRRRALLLGISVLAFLMIRIRFYLGWAMSMAALASFGPLAVRALRAGRTRQAAEAAAVPAALVCLTLVSRCLRNIQFRELFCPVHSGPLGVVLAGTVAAVVVLVSVGADATRRFFHRPQVRRALLGVILIAGAAAGMEVVMRPPTHAPSRTYHPLADLAQSLATSPVKVVGLLMEATPTSLSNYRQTSVVTGGHSLMDPGATISTTGRLIGYVPRALMIGLLAPFPNQWLDTRGSTGVMRACATIDMVLWYGAMPWLVAGIVWCLRRRQPDAILVLVFGMMALLPIALVVANLGTLFRLRLQALLPLLIIAGVGDPRDEWRRARAWLAARVVRPQPAAVPTPPTGPSPAAAHRPEPALERAR